MTTDTLKLNEAAKMLRVSKNTIYKLAKDGSIPARKVGGTWIVSRAKLADFIRGEDAA